MVLCAYALPIRSVGWLQSSTYCAPLSKEVVDCWTTTYLRSFITPLFYIFQINHKIALFITKVTVWKQEFFGTIKFFLPLHTVYLKELFFCFYKKCICLLPFDAKMGGLQLLAQKYFYICAPTSPASTPFIHPLFHPYLQFWKNPAFNLLVLLVFF